MTDASAILEVLVQTPAAANIEDRIFAASESLHAPHLIDLEIDQVLRRYVTRGDMYPDRARMALDLFSSFPITRYSHEPLPRRIWVLRPNLTAYDAACGAGRRLARTSADARRTSGESAGQPRHESS